MYYKNLCAIEHIWTQMRTANLSNSGEVAAWSNFLSSRTRCQSTSVYKVLIWTSFKVWLRTYPFHHWRKRCCNYDQAVSIATKICHRMHTTPWFALLNARFVSIVWIQNYVAFVRIVVATSQTGQSAHRSWGETIMTWHTIQHKLSECLNQSI